MDLVRETLRSLRAHAFRFGLTSTGIVWGTLMLTYLTATTTGAQRHFTEQVEKVGERIVWLFPGSVAKQNVGERGARRVELELEDVTRAETLESVRRADPNLAMFSSIVRATPRTRLLTVFGVTTGGQRIRNFAVESGRFVDESDVRSGARVAFLGAEAATRLFGRAPAVGRTIQIESIRFRVVGVAKRKGAQLVHISGRDDEAVLVPIGAMQRWLEKEDRVEVMVVEPASVGASFGVRAQVRQLVGLHQGFDPRAEAALSEFNIQDAIGLVRAVFDGLHLFLYAASAVTLFVGAVGVMNIMLVVVGERRREIGLRKAVGATRRAIFVQFLAEAAAVATAAGALGAGLGLGLVQVLATGLAPDDPGSSPPIVDPVTAAVIACALAGTAIAASVVPALRAARVSPAESLRDL